MGNNNKKFQKESLQFVLWCCGNFVFFLSTFDFLCPNTTHGQVDCPLYIICKTMLPNPWANSWHNVQSTSPLHAKCNKKLQQRNITCPRVLPNPWASSWPNVQSKTQLHAKCNTKLQQKHITCQRVLHRHRIGSGSTQIHRIAKHDLHQPSQHWWTPRTSMPKGKYCSNHNTKTKHKIYVSLF